MKKCKICKTEFQAKTSKAYCSDKCRKLGYNASKYEYVSRNLDYYQQYHKEWNKNNPEKCKTKGRKYRRSDHAYDKKLRSIYGITIEQYNQMLEDQNYVCAICKCPETWIQEGQIRRMSVDHDHESGKVRQLLCGRCNTVLGHVNDNPELLLSLVEYLYVHNP